jgi:hypothetical protein
MIIYNKKVSDNKKTKKLQWLIKKNEHLSIL